MPTRVNRVAKKKTESKAEWSLVEQILLEAEIVARWAKNPFYIS